MLSPVAVATWIAFCIPWAEPRLAAALVKVGSNGEPYLIADSNDNQEKFQTYADAVKSLRTRLSKTGANPMSTQDAVYVGLTQIPTFALAELGIDPETALDKCANLEIGYSLFLTAYEFVGKKEKSPWKKTAAAFSYFRSRQMLMDSPYAKRATDFLMLPSQIRPAGINQPLYHSVAAEWSSGLAYRSAIRSTASVGSILTSAAEVAEWARKSY